MQERLFLIVIGSRTQNALTSMYQRNGRDTGLNKRQELILVGRKLYQTRQQDASKTPVELEQSSSSNTVLSQLLQKCSLGSSLLPLWQFLRSPHPLHGVRRALLRTRAAPSTTTAANSAFASLFESLGIDVSDVNVPICLGCSPITACPRCSTKDRFITNAPFKT